jgi:hypothetical protein
MLRAILTIGFIAAAAGLVHAQDSTGNGDAAVLRGLDRVNGMVNDITVPVGTTVQLGTLNLTLDECRYPTDNPSGDAFAHLSITEVDEVTPIFKGWMIASSPALNALEHSRYDVWVLRCAINATSSQ